MEAQRENRGLGLLLTSALDGVRWSAPRPDRFTTGYAPVPIVYESGWALGPAWTGAENSPAPAFDPRTVQHVASRCTRYVIPAHTT